MKTILTIICAFILQSICYSQQDSQYTQYMYNTTLVNPAYAGSRETITAFLLHRNQWVGLDGAPVTNNFSINSPFKTFLKPGKHAKHLIILYFS